MAFTSIGYDGSVNEAQWSQLLLALADVKHKVTSGFSVTPAASALTLSISAGEAVVAGVKVTGTTETRTVDPGGASARIDMVVVELDWSTNTTDYKVVKGTSLTPPSLTQTAGVKWQMPLARVRVPAGHNAPIPSGNIERCAPRPIREIVDATSDFNGRIALSSGNPEPIATLSMPDPGWPYRMRVKAVQRFETDGGAVTGTQNGVVVLVATSWQTGNPDGEVEFARGATGKLTANSGEHDAEFDATSVGVYTGPRTVRLSIAALGSAPANNLHTARVNRFEVTLIPA